jgi:F0F1-type ATP synthase membrane subunit b/b'
MNAIEVASFAAAIASLVLAIVAIVLSIVFYQMSSRLSESAKEAAKDIGSSVEKLEKLFDRLYADTFSMMKDTVSDMRKHAWGEATSETPNILEEAEKKAEEKTEALRKTFEDQVARVLEGQKITEGRIGIIRSELKQLVDRAINDSRNVEHEAREETLRGHIIERILHISKNKGKVLADDVVSYLHKQFPGGAVVRELGRMKEEGLVAWDGSLGPSTEINLT